MTHSFPTRRSSDLDGTAVDNQGSFQIDHANVRSQGSGFANAGVVTIADAGLLEVTGSYIQSSGSTVLHGGTLAADVVDIGQGRSEEHTSELQSLMRISYAVFCLKKKINTRS